MAEVMVETSSSHVLFDVSKAYSVVKVLPLTLPNPPKRSKYFPHVVINPQFLASGMVPFAFTGFHDKLLMSNVQRTFK